MKPAHATPKWIWQHADWPRFLFDAEALVQPLAQARLAQGKILGAARWLDERLSLEAWSELVVEEGLTTSAIEGEKLNLEEVRSSVARRLGLPTAGLPPPQRAVEGLVEVLLDATREHARPLTLERLCSWQASLFPSGSTKLGPWQIGALRGEDAMQVISGPIGRERVHFEAPPRADLERLLGAFLLAFENKPASLDGLLHAGLAHLHFLTLHPFEDGNGRLARALTDMALCRDEGQARRFFSLSAQLLEEREGYYHILEATQRGGLDVTPWLQFFLARVESAAQAAQAKVAATIARARFWLRHQQEDLNARQRKVLNRLLEAGPGGFVGGLNTRKYQSLTSTSRATAYRELTDLVAKGCLAPLSGQGGRSSAYEIAWPAASHLD